MGSKAVPDYLVSKGCQVKRKCDLFGKVHTPDEDWLEWCGEEWVALTKDEAIRNRYSELMAAKRSKVRMFYFPNQGLTSREYVQYLEQHWEAIVGWCNRPGPFIVAIYSDRLKRFE